MRFLVRPKRSVLIVVVTLLFCGTPAEAQTTGGELTAEQYRDLIVQTADPMLQMDTYGDVGPGAGGGCIMTFTRTPTTTQNAASLRQTWAQARVPAPLRASHTEILSWMQSMEGMAGRMPSCVQSAFQSSAEQMGFFLSMSNYNDSRGAGLRATAAAALNGMGVTLPPLPAEPR